MASFLSGASDWWNGGGKNFAANALNDLGFGLTQSTTGLGGALGAATAYSEQQQPARDLQAEKIAAQKQQAQQLQTAIANLRDKYQRPDLADAVSQGYDVNKAWQDVLTKKAPVDLSSTTEGRQQLASQYNLTGADAQNYVLTGKLPAAMRANAPIAYRFTNNGQSLEPIPGGPADPASAQGLTPESLNLIASQYLAGDKSAISGYARNANMRAQIANAVATMANAQGMDGKAIAAEVSAYGGNVAAQRSAGTRAAQVGMAASEANQMADIALTASDKVPRSSFVPWNAAMNAVATGTSSPEMAAFVTATTSLVNAYARAVSPLGAPTDAMRQHAEQMLNTAQGPEAYKAVIAQMKNEMQAALNAPAEVSERLKQGVTGAGQQNLSDDLSTMSDADLLNALNN